MKCLRENNSENALCRNESKEYLECRMERQVHADNPRVTPSAPRLPSFPSGHGCGLRQARARVVPPAALLPVDPGLSGEWC